MKYIKIVVFSAVLFYLSYFASFNLKTIPLRFLDESLLGEGFKPLVVNLPLFAYLFIAVLGTMIIMSALGIIERTALRLKAKKFEKENLRLKAELETYRATADKPKRAALSPKEGGEGRRILTGKKKKGEGAKKERTDTE